MPLYKEQGIVLRSIKLGEADKIVSILTQGSGKIRAVAESFLLKLLSLSGFHPSLSGCAVCGMPGPHEWFSAAQGGVICAEDVEHDAGRASRAAIAWLDLVARADLEGSGEATPPTAV